jgi:Fic family protein
MKYNWQQQDWPHFKYDLSGIEDTLFSFTERAGRVGGLLKGLAEDIRTETVIGIMVSEALKTSEIEGEYLNRIDVVSSIQKNMGLVPEKERVGDKRAQGIAALMIDVRDSYAKKLTKAKLFSWHRMVMQGTRGVKAGAWRTHKEPMVIVSGSVGREKVHFEAPLSEQIPQEMKRFIGWFNDTGRGGKKEIKNPLIRSAITHLYFESIHPFEDGNGRIGRALSDKALLQGFEGPILLSLSRIIEQNKKKYYQAFKQAQRSNEITPWVAYFSKMALKALIDTEQEIEFTVKKTKFFDRYETVLNQRQLKVIRRMLAEGPGGFTGGMSAKKYISITKTSKATATRDLQDLVRKGIFIPQGAGRSVRYEILL